MKEATYSSILLKCKKWHPLQNTLGPVLPGRTFRELRHICKRQIPFKKKPAEAFRLNNEECFYYKTAFRILKRSWIIQSFNRRYASVSFVSHERVNGKYGKQSRNFSDMTKKYRGLFHDWLASSRVRNTLYFLYQTQPHRKIFASLA